MVSLGRSLLGRNLWVVLFYQLNQATEAGKVTGAASFSCTQDEAGTRKHIRTQSLENTGPPWCAFPRAPTTSQEDGPGVGASGSNRLTTEPDDMGQEPLGIV